MPEKEVVRNIIKGLKSSIGRYIGIMANDSLDELKGNIRKYEMIEFMLNGEVTQSPFETETALVRSQICNAAEHIAINCQVFLNKQKKLENRLNTADNCSPLISAQASHIINKIQDTPDALYIHARFNDSIIPITVDTGANIC